MVFYQNTFRVRSQGTEIGVLQNTIRAISYWVLEGCSLRTALESYHKGNEKTLLSEHHWNLITWANENHILSEHI